MTIGTALYVLRLQSQRQQWVAHDKLQRGSTTVLEQHPLLPGARKGGKGRSERMNYKIAASLFGPRDRYIECCTLQLTVH